MAKSKRAQQLQKEYIASLIKRETPVMENFTDKERRAHQAWCFENGILIYFTPIDYYVGSIVIEENGVSITGEYKYKIDLKKLKPKDDNWSKIIFKLYTQKFLENNGGN